MGESPLEQKASAAELGDLWEKAVLDSLKIELVVVPPADHMAALLEEKVVPKIADKVQAVQHLVEHLMLAGEEALMDH